MKIAGKTPLSVGQHEGDAKIWKQHEDIKPRRCRWPLDTRATRRSESNTKISNRHEDMKPCKETWNHTKRHETTQRDMKPREDMKTNIVPHLTPYFRKRRIIHWLGPGHLSYLLRKVLKSQFCTIDNYNFKRDFAKVISTFALPIWLSLSY